MGPLLPCGCQLTCLCACCEHVLATSPFPQSSGAWRSWAGQSGGLSGAERRGAERLCVCARVLKIAAVTHCPLFLWCPLLRTVVDSLDSDGAGEAALSRSFFRIRLLFLTLWLHLPVLVFVLFHIWICVDQFWVSPSCSSRHFFLNLCVSHFIQP